MPDCKNLDTRSRCPRASGCDGDLLRCIFNIERNPSSQPSGTTHRNYDSRVKFLHKRTKMIDSASADPWKYDRAVHLPIFEAQYGVCEKNSCITIFAGRFARAQSDMLEELKKFFVGLVPVFFRATVPFEISNVAEILADDENLWPRVP
jgi:hypothetical protein